MRQVPIEACGPEPDPELAQWYTPPTLARNAALMALSLCPCPDSLLEPSAGRGALLGAFVEVGGVPENLCAIAIELDRSNQSVLEERFAWAHVWGGDYLAQWQYYAGPQGYDLFDLAIANPPFDGGEERDHVEKVLRESRTTVLVLPSRSLHGRARFDCIWKRHGRDFWIRREARCIVRPKFGDQAGIDEIVVLGITRTPGPTELEWW